MPTKIFDYFPEFCPRLRANSHTFRPLSKGFGESIHPTMTAKGIPTVDLIEDIRTQFVIPGECFPIDKMNNFIIKKYFKTLMRKGQLDEYEHLMFEVLGSEILYRKNEKRKQSKIIQHSSAAISTSI